MKRLLLTGAAATLLAASATGALAQQLKPEEKVKFRQAAYTTMAWNMGKIKAMVEGGAPFSQPQVSAAANVIAAIANSGMGALYSPDTLGVVGFKKSRLKENFFQEQEEVRKIATNFVEQANKLAEVAAMGNQDEIKAQFGEVGKACKACHDKFRAEK